MPNQVTPYVVQHYLWAICHEGERWSGLSWWHLLDLWLLRSDGDKSEDWCLECTPGMSRDHWNQWHDLLTFYTHCHRPTAQRMVWRWQKIWITSRRWLSCHSAQHRRGYHEQCKACSCDKIGHQLRNCSSDNWLPGVTFPGNVSMPGQIIADNRIIVARG